MRTREQYPTLRRGREALRQQEAAAWKQRTSQLRKWRSNFAYWLGIRLLRWGYRLERSALLDEMASYPS